MNRLPTAFFRLRRPRLKLQPCWLVCLAWLASNFGGRTSFAQNANPDFWQAQSIYQIITDRFANGDPANDNADGNYRPSGKSGRSVHGGDFKGLEAKLDYVRALGATAIWISPVVLNAHGEFHGYCAQDFYRVDPHWGTLQDLQRLTAAAHARGLLVIDDIVVNHGGDLIDSPDPGYPHFLEPPAGYTLRYRSTNRYSAPFDIYNQTYNATNNALTNLFHNQGEIQDYGQTSQVLLGELSGLDDFRTESPYVRAQMAAIYEFWITNAGFDGFRIDTTRHVETGFWQTWCPQVHAFAASHQLPNFFMFGEVEDDSDAGCGAYTGTIGGGAFKQDSVLDYPLYFRTRSVFAGATGNTKQIEDHYHAVDRAYDPSARMRLVTFLDNHDQPRFLSTPGATTNRLKTALVFLYTSRGIPCLYYGTEQGFNGRTDPCDREDMFAGQFKDGASGADSFDLTHPLFQLVAKLNNFRRLYPVLALGAQVNQWNDPQGPGLFAYARRLRGNERTPHEAFVVLNTSTNAQVLTNRPTAFTPGAKIVNLLDTHEVLTVLRGPRTPLVTMPGSSAKIFIPLTDLQPLDPVVTATWPAHDAANVAAHASLRLQFSEPMDARSVQAAFHTRPPVAGSFAWSPDHDAMTFLPTGGWPDQADITVLVSNTALSSVSGKSMHAPFQLLFHTGVGLN